jgi:hypothetical protein
MQSAFARILSLHEPLPVVLDESNSLAALWSWAGSQVLLDRLGLGDLLGKLGQVREGLLVSGNLLWDLGADSIKQNSDSNIGVGVVSAGDALAVVLSNLLLNKGKHGWQNLGLQLVLQLLLAGLVLLVLDLGGQIANVAEALVDLISDNSVLWGLASEVGNASNGADDSRALDNNALLASLRVGVLENWELLGWVLLLHGWPVGVLDANILKWSSTEVEHPADELSASRDVEVDNLQLHLGQIAAATSGVRARGGAWLGATACGASGSATA